MSIIINPRISVIMSVYKEPLEWLRQSIDSILQQTYFDFEFIIICDNPEYAEGIRLLNDYATMDDRIKLIFNEINIGLTKSLNKGFLIAKGDYIARMDADDISINTRLEKQLSFMDGNPSIGVCGTAFEEFGSVSRVVVLPERIEDSSFIIIPFFAHPSVMMRRSVLIQLPFVYNEEYRLSQDYELWSRLYFLTEFHNLPEILLKYRISSSQISSANKKGQLGYAIQMRRLFLKRIIENEFSDSIDIENYDINTFRIIRGYLVRFNGLTNKGLNETLPFFYKSIPRGQRFSIIKDVLVDLFNKHITIKTFMSFVLTINKSFVAYI